MEIPQKSTFKLDEVCKITDVKPYVLRFWESEFDEISPISSSSGQKIYEHKDLEVIKQLRGFLFEEKLTVEQARLKLQNPQSKLVQPKEEVEEDAVRNDFYSERDVQKLVLAKAKLQSIISKTQSIKNIHNWA